MGTTTFSGPIRAGNIRNTTGTTVGTNIANVGYVVMVQQHVMDISGGAVAAEATNIVIPADSKIVDIIIDLEVAANATTNISVGDSVGGPATLVNAVASGTTVGIKPLGASGGGTLTWKNTGATDLKLTATVKRSYECGISCYICNVRSSV
jgi:hypothetical protein